MKTDVAHNFKPVRIILIVGLALLGAQIARIGLDGLYAARSSKTQLLATCDTLPPTPPYGGFE